MDGPFDTWVRAVLCRLDALIACCQRTVSPAQPVPVGGGWPAGSWSPQSLNGLYAATWWIPDSPATVVQLAPADPSRVWLQYSMGTVGPICPLPDFSDSRQGILYLAAPPFVLRVDRDGPAAWWPWYGQGIGVYTAIAITAGSAPQSFAAMQDFRQVPLDLATVGIR